MKRSLFLAVVCAAVFLSAPWSFAQQLQPNASRGRSLFGRGLMNRQGGAIAPAQQQPQDRQAGSQAQPAQAQSAQTAVESGGRSIEFNGAPVEMVLKVYGDLVDKTVLKDPAAPAATITLQPKQGQELSNEEKILAIETVLEMNGIHLEPYGEKFVRAVPRATARKEGIPLVLDPDASLDDTSRVVSMMMTFRNIPLDEAKTAIEGLKSDKGVLNVYERSGSILVTDTEMNIARMREIIKEIDIPTPVTENVFIRQIQNANASDIQKVLQEIVEDAKKILEKQGKQAQNANRQAQQPMQPFGARLIGNRPSQNAAATPRANDSVVTAVSDADRGMIRGDSLIIADERSNKLIIKTQKSNMDFFDKVIEQLDVETTPDTVVKVYRLKYAECEDVADMINDLIGNAASSKSSTKGSQNANSKQAGGQKSNVTTGTTQKKSVNQRTGEAKTGELSKENTTVLADKRINGIVVMTNKELVPVLEQIIDSMDIKLSQVLIETCIIEVGLGHGLESGIDWVQKGRKSEEKIGEKLKDSLGRQLYYPYAKNTSGEYSSSIINYGGTPVLAGTEGASNVEALKNLSIVARDGLLNYYSGGAYGMGGGAQGGQEAFNLAKGVTTNLLNKSFSFVFDSDKLGLSTILHMTENDSRSKYIASPIIMTLDNKEAVINATSMHYLLKGFTSSGNSYSTIAVPDYEQKELGIEIKATPKINPNGTVMLTVEEKYTQLGANETIQYSSSNGSSGSGGLQSVQVPTTVTREMSSDILLENGQTVVFGGLTDTTTSESETGIPFLKDIPFIGRWLFGSTEQTEMRTELLVFMTPYVLDDAQAAQAEALRRKKTMSDSRPWEDHGWSKSELADPISKHEQLRRLKEEWKKQDEDHTTGRELDWARKERALHLRERAIEDAKDEEKREKKYREADENLSKMEAESAVKAPKAGATAEESNLGELANELAPKK